MTRLPEALYVVNKIIEIDRKCLAEQKEECLTDFDRAAVRTGIPGAYSIRRNRELCDDLSIKAEIFLAMGDPKSALQAAEYAANPVVHRGQDPEPFWLNKYGRDDGEDLLKVGIRSLYRHEHIAPETLIQHLHRMKELPNAQKIAVRVISQFGEECTKVLSVG